MLGIPNFLNVITNLPFLVVGLVGMEAVKKVKGRKLKVICNTLFTGFALLSFGSSYYHLWPANQTLVYDRIPMVIIFMSFFSFIIYMCMGEKKAFAAFFLLTSTGVVSVLYWIFTEGQGRGDLRWYGMVQFFPLVAIPLLLFSFPSSMSTWKKILFIFLFFGFAKLTETFDQEIYQALHYTISGHSLKHLLMAAAGYEIVVLVRKIELPPEIPRKNAKC